MKKKVKGNIAFLHSKLSKGERFDEWQRIKKGEVQIAVGANSNHDRIRPTAHHWFWTRRQATSDEPSVTSRRGFVMDMLVDIQPSVFVGRVLLVLRCSVSLLPLVSGIGSVPDHSHDG